MKTFREFVNESKDPTGISNILKAKTNLSGASALNMAKSILNSKNPKAIIFDNIDDSKENLEKLWSMIQDEM